jgi:capsular exopolysaccharide synthesis family protein
MSRIDEALRIRERGSGRVAPEADANRPSRSSPLVEYQSEVPDAHAHDAPASGRAAELSSPRQPSPALHRVAPDVSARTDNADLQARLVTSTKSTVSVEQYRRLAAALHDWQIEHQSKTLMITSALPHEGKTLTVVNLALTLSESYARRVLVIDADLRSPGVHRALGIPNDRGLSEALSVRHDLRYVAVSDRLSVMTAGRPGLAPLAGLTSSRMREVLEECAARFDWVLIDTPPVGVLTDAQVLVRLVGGILLVIGAGSTPAAAIERAVAEFGGPEAIIGTVLNRVEEQTIPEAAYYGRYGYYGGPVEARRPGRD